MNQFFTNIKDRLKTPEGGQYMATLGAGILGGMAQGDRDRADRRMTGAGNIYNAKAAQAQAAQNTASNLFGNYVDARQGFGENTMSDIPDRLRMASALGWPETIMQITHEDIIKAHRNYFVRENMEIYIAGNIDAIGGMAMLKHTLDEFLIKMPAAKERGSDGDGKAREPFIPKHIGNPKKPVFDHTYEEIGLSSRQQSSLSLSTTIPRMDAGHKHTDEHDAHLAALDLTSKLIADLDIRK